MIETVNRVEDKRKRDVTYDMVDSEDDGIIVSKIILNIDCGIYDAKLSQFIDKNVNKTIRLYTFGRTWIPFDDVDELIDNLSEDYIVHNLLKNIYFFNDNIIGKFSISSTGLVDGVIHYTNKDELENIISIVDRLKNTAKKLNIKWITSGDGNYYDIIELMSDIVYDSVYPNIPIGVHNYIDDFLSSNSSILILIGRAGTGKSSLIREIISKMDKRAYVTYNQTVFNGDDAFAEFVSSDTSGAFVIEDADLLLKSRDTGNELMAKFLNIGDGIIKLNGKKLIFSTNLPSTKDIDPAIMRAGRCYDVLNFNTMTLEQANKVCEDYNLDSLSEDKEYRLTDIFNRKQVKEQRSIGFV